MSRKSVMHRSNQKQNVGKRGCFKVQAKSEEGKIIWTTFAIWKSKHYFQKKKKNTLKPFCFLLEIAVFYMPVYCSLLSKCRSLLWTLKSKMNNSRMAKGLLLAQLKWRSQVRWRSENWVYLARNQNSCFVFCIVMIKWEMGVFFVRSSLRKSSNKRAPDAASLSSLINVTNTQQSSITHQE